MRILTEFEQLVLVAVARIGEASYGMVVQEEMSRSLGKSVSLAAVYSTLNRLEDEGLVTSWIAPPSGRRGGRATKHFVLEREGALALRSSHERLRRLFEGLDLDAFLG